MLTLTSFWGSKASYSETSCYLGFFLDFFFQSDRPTQYQETHSTLNEKIGDGLKELCHKIYENSNGGSWKSVLLHVMNLFF